MEKKKENEQKEGIQRKIKIKILWENQMWEISGVM
jgi:hypothetical protein